MYINKFLIFITVLLAGCGTNRSMNTAQIATSNPTDISESYMYSTSLYGSDNGGPSANIAVLLPASGSSKTIGNDIKTSIETAFLRKIKPNIKVSFYDLSGDLTRRKSVINTALNDDPDIIIGPIFAEDATILRDTKSSRIPVISFTSDVKALGDNVMTTNLIPTQSIETIIRQMTKDGATNMVVFAPNDNSGQSMAAVADKVASAYNIPIKGLYYYTPGNSDEIKDVAMRASIYKVRTSVNNRAREVLSDILNKESLTSQTKHNIYRQLEKISRTETLGNLPYDAVLFLGNGEDSKTIASFLRYYGVGNRDAVFYGTTLWHGSDVASDFTMTGAKYATLPEISENFNSLYDMMAGKTPDYLAAFGYDAANLALGMIYSPQSQSSYLFDPSGYIGTAGVFRIQPTGESERTLRIMELNGSGEPVKFEDAPMNFLVPLYSVNTSNLRNVSEKEINASINPGDYITIPDDLRRKSQYRTKSIKTKNFITTSEEEIIDTSAPIQIYESDENETVSNPEFESVKSETVSRQYIDSVEIEER